MHHSTDKKTGKTTDSLNHYLSVPLCDEVKMKLGTGISYFWQDGYAQGLIAFDPDGRYHLTRNKRETHCFRFTMTYKKGMPYFKDWTDLPITAVQSGKIYFKIPRDALDFSKMI